MISVQLLGKKSIHLIPVPYMLPNPSLSVGFHSLILLSIHFAEHWRTCACYKNQDECATPLAI